MGAYIHILSFLGVFIPVLYYGAQNKDEEPQGDDAQYEARVSNIKLALFAIGAVYFGHRMFKQNIPDNFKPFQRLWLVFGNMCYVYLYVLVFIYFMNASDARKMWGFVEERLGKPVTKDYHTYDDDCELTWFNIIDNMDHYFLAHFTNWFLAAIILRDSPILHFWSILDEVLELSAQYRLPHFRECWWDHVFHDFLLTNTPAIILGLKFSKMLGLREYDWLGRKGKKSVWDWKVLNDHYRFFGIFQMYVIISANFLCGFFMINVLWIPPLSIPTLTRMYIWFLLGNLVFKEGYNIAEDRDNPKTRHIDYDTPQKWVTYGIVMLEIAISWKFEKDAGNLQDEPMYIGTKLFWGTIFAVVAVYYLYLKFVRDTDAEFFEKHKGSAVKRTPRKINSSKKSD
jgi:phosphatidylserine synthase 2